MLTLAHYEAQKARQPYIGVEHLLLALVSSNDQVMKKILAELKISPQAVRLKLHEQIPEIAAKGDELKGLKDRFRTEFMHNLAFYVPQPIRALFGRWIDPSQPPPLG